MYNQSWTGCTYNQLVLIPQWASALTLVLVPVWASALALVLALSMFREIDVGALLSLFVLYVCCDAFSREASSEQGWLVLWWLALEQDLCKGNIWQWRSCIFRSAAHPLYRHKPNSIPCHIQHSDQDSPANHLS